MPQQQEVIHSKIWEETAEPDNPFAAAACYCHGYDVYGDLLGKASWTEYLYLLFRGERPTSKQAKLLESLAVALANPGPRDPSVHAAMSGGVGGSTYASCLTAALAVGAGNYGGAHEVKISMDYWLECGQELSLWKKNLRHPPGEERADIWLPFEHAAGFDPNGASCATPVRQTLAYLAAHSEGVALPWLMQNRIALETTAGYPLAMSGVAAAALTDLGFTPSYGEMAYLLLRLPGAAVHALEQEHYGHKRFPFFKDGLILQNDPGPTQTTIT
ncbi:MAG: citryl-CoA lyase [Pseudomonadota bacterium]